jgi:hypothetical protein
MAFGSTLLFADTDRGVDLYNQGKYAEAQSELSKAVESNPDDARARRFLGLALVEQHKPAEAQEHLAKATELDPSGNSKLALARMYIEQKDFDKAEDLLKDAQGEDLDYVRGLLQLNRQQNKEAAASLESYLQDHPNHPYAHYYAGLAYNGAKRPDKMLTHFETFMRLNLTLRKPKKCVLYCPPGARLAEIASLAQIHFAVFGAAGCWPQSASSWVRSTRPRETNRAPSSRSRAAETGNWARGLEAGLQSLRPACGDTDVRVQSLAAPVCPAFASVDRLSVEIDLRRALSGAYYLEDAVLDNARVHVVIAEDGRDNIPRPPRKTRSQPWSTW